MSFKSASKNLTSQYKLTFKGGGGGVGDFYSVWWESEAIKGLKVSSGRLVGKIVRLKIKFENKIKSR